MIFTEDKKTYIEAIKKLFPKGTYWENLLNKDDKDQSDISLIAKVKADELYNYREKMSNLQKESVMTTCTGATINDWERIYGKVNSSLTLEQRKKILGVEKNSLVNIAILKNIAKYYEATIHDVFIPFRPGIFGHSAFGQQEIASLAALSVVFITATVEIEMREPFELAINEAMLANQIIFFSYGGNE